MARIKKFTEYVNEDYSFDSAIQRGKSMLSKIGNWASGFIQKLKNGLFPLIPEGPKAGTPMVAYFPAGDKKSIVDQLRELDRGTAEESAESELDLGDQKIEEGMKDLNWDAKGILNLGAAKIKEMLKERYDFLMEGDAEKPLFIFGAPGIGKTQMVAQVCDELGIDLMKVDLQFMDPADFLGVPDPRKVASDDPLASGVTVGNPPKWLPRSNDGKKYKDRGGIIFFDEMNRANLPVRQGMMALARERAITGYELPDKWVIVAAGNRPFDDPGAIEDMGTALTDRFSAVNYLPTVKGFQDYIATDDLPITKSGLKPREVVLPELFTFLEFSEEWFHTLDPSQPDVKFATPRGWVDASILLNAKMRRLKKQGKVDNEMSKEELVEIFQTEVGETAARAFANFYEIVQSIPLADVMKVFDEPEKAPIPDPIHKSEPGKFNTTYKPDIMYATLAAIVSKSEKIKPLTPQQYENAIDYAIRLDSAAFGACFVSMLNSKHEYIKTDRKYSMHLNKFSEHYGFQ